MSENGTESNENGARKVQRNGRGSLRTHADLHDVAAAVTGAAVALEIAGRVSAGAVAAHPVHDLALVDICARAEGEK